MVKDGMSIRQLRVSQIRVNQSSLNQKVLGSMSESIRGHFQVAEWSQSEDTQELEAIMEEQSYL
eukprot:4322806-Amphidinium_carterae.1